MKRPVWTVFLACAMAAAGLAAGQSQTAAKSAPELKGDWNGSLQVGAQKLSLILEVSESADEPAVLVSVDQGGARIPVDALSLDDGAVEFAVAAINGSYKGKLNSEGDRIEGQWTQNGVTLPLVLTRSAD